MMTMINCTIDGFCVGFLNEYLPENEINDNMFILSPENIMYNNSKRFIGDNKKLHLYCDKFNIEVKSGLNIRIPDFS